MIIRCPKCQFSQPEDQYCAQCGVNMVNYRPPKASLIKQILNNMAFQLVAVIALASLAVVVALQKQNSKTETAQGMSSQKIRSSAFLGKSANENSELEIANQDSVNPTGIQTTAVPAELIPTSADGATGDQNQNIAASARTAEGAPETVAATTTTPSGKPAPAVPLVNPRQVKITYAELTNRGYYLLTEESRTSGQFNSFADYSAGMVHGIAKKLAELPRDFKVISSETITIDGGKALQTVLNYKDRNREPASADFQVSTSIQLEAAEGANLRAEVEVLKTAKTTERANYPASFDVMSDTGYFISGFHHGKTSFEAERTFDSELVVLVEFLR